MREFFIAASLSSLTEAAFFTAAIPQEWLPHCSKRGIMVGNSRCNDVLEI
jgi:hypothetical protein